MNTDNVCRNFQHGGNHYVKHNIQPWDIVKDWKLDFFEGNVVKYVVRVKVDRLEDLKKACHYLQEILETTKKVPKRKFNKVTITAEEIIKEYNFYEKQESEVIHYLHDAIKTNDLHLYKTYLSYALVELQKIIMELTKK